MPDDLSSPHASVIIPAHDEERVIGRCLRSLKSSSSGPLEIIVVANGCTDSTVAIASEIPGVTVIDLQTPSKIAALNAGDEAASVYPRIYLDADIELGARAVDQLIDVLRDANVVAAAPRVTFRTGASSASVRAFYAVFTRLPYVTDNLLGLGVYGLNRRARERFDRFPDVLGDDLFVQRLFTPDERVVVPAEFVVQAPRTLRSLLKVRVRVARGNAELASLDGELGADLSPSTSATSTALVGLLRDKPQMLPQVLTYVAITVAARLMARRRRAERWERDSSTR